MCTAAQLQDINSKIASEYRNVFGKDLKKVFLFGSYARGDYDQESDIDYTAIVAGERYALQKKMDEIWDYSASLGLENNVVISPGIIPEDEFEKYRATLPYYQNIDKEGIGVE